MKAQVLVYDDNCPLCIAYSQLFVRYGLLQPEERKPFSTIDESLIAAIDFEKAKNEIPLIDMNSGEVLYGIDALVSILSRKAPLIKKIVAVKPVDWFLSRLYKFISFNRKVIVAKRCSQGTIDCAPSCNYFYRSLFLLFFLSFNTAMLYPVHTQLLNHLPNYHLSFMQLQVAHFLLVTINCTLSLSLSVKNAFEYLGQVNMLALTTIGLLLLFIPVAHLLNNASTIIIGYFLGLTIFIFKEYLRRMHYAGILQRHHWIAALNITSIAMLLLLLIN
ncbi:MAG: hypothetical protein QM802_18870 [Agriterribacter sp.]